MRISVVIVSGLLLGLISSASCEEFAFENDVVRWVVGSDGLNKSLQEKAPDRQWLAEGPARLAYLKTADKTFPATAIARDDDLLRIAFGDSGITADYRITPQSHYFVVELVAIHDQNGRSAESQVEEICLTQLGSRIRENIGGWIAVEWNDDFAVCLMGLSDRVCTVGSRAVLYREFGMLGEKVAVIAVPTPQFLDVVQEVERDHRLPAATIGGRWAKRSDDVRRGYLFTDLTEENVDETIRYAKLGEFGYVMTYSGTWSTSLGSYPINLKNFPRGEESLRATIEKCHAAGLKVGMHMLTSFVHKHDPLVRPKPDPRLLKDAESALAADVDAATTDIAAALPLDDFPRQAAYYGAARQGFDIVIDDEIIRYREIGGPDGKTFLQCARGANGTQAAAHRAGAKIHHLAERYGCYLVDLRTTLKDELAERIAGLIDRCGFDMIYFDGGECNSANGPYWYWVSKQQEAVYQRVRRDLFVQGSGGTAWTWHFFSRGCCDDFAAIAPKQYLDYHKIGDSWRHYTKSFMPAELGWWGFLDDTPDHPATSPDEVEFYAVRMLALDTPVSLETNLSALKKNGRTEELLRLLAEYERLRIGGAVPASVRQALSEGEWHMTRADGAAVLRPVRYDAYHAAAPGEVAVENRFEAQPLKFRLQAAPALAPVGDASNIVLLRSDPPLSLKPADAAASMPGAPAGEVEFTKPVGQQGSIFMVGPQVQFAGGEQGKTLDLVRHRGLAVRLRVDSPPVPPGEPCPVLSVQLEAGAETYRDHYIDLDFQGEKTVILSEPTPERMLPEFRPAYANYAFKAACYHFNYRGIVGLNFRWMRLPKDRPVACAVSLVEALAESDAPLKNPRIAVGDRELAVGAELATGDYAEYWGDGPVEVFDRNGTLLRTVEPTGQTPVLSSGRNRVTLGSDAPAAVKFTVITLDEANAVRLSPGK